MMLRALIAVIMVGSASYFGSCASVNIIEQQILKIDQMQYIAELRKRRSDLLREDCKGNLIAKPEFRAKILTGSSIFSLIQDLYSLQMQNEDKQWAEEFRYTHALGEVHSGFKVASFYDISAFAGYLVGNANPVKGKNLLTHPFIDSRGIGFKVFFQMKDFQKDLRANDFKAFAQALSAAGFRGDIKVQLPPGNMRFKFNNIVVHSASKEDSFVAENTGLRFFQGKLAAISRGVDVDTDLGGDEPALDWSQFLCANSFAILPADVKSYVNYLVQNPITK